MPSWWGILYASTCSLLNTPAYRVAPLRQPAKSTTMKKRTSPSLTVAALCFSALLSSIPLPAMASEPTTGTLIIISSVGGWLTLGLLPFVVRQFLKNRAMRKTMAEME